MNQLDLAMDTYGILIETDPNNPRLEFVKARIEKLEGVSK